MTSLTQDIVYGIRLLGRTRSFTSAVSLTLAVGIAATTTMFTLLNATLLLPYPVHGELTGSSGYRSLVQASTVPPPPVRTETSR
jgi:hypothetical protein